MIRAETDQLRAVARQMRSTVDQINSGTDSMRQSMDALDATWSGSARDRGIARWAEITPKYPPAAEGLTHLANELEALAQRLDDAAAVFGGASNGGNSPITTIPSPLPENGSTPIPENGSAPTMPQPTSWADRYAQIHTIDTRIAELQSKLGPENSTVPSDLEARQELQQLTTQREQLLKPIVDGLPNDGPSPNKDGFIGCTNYIAEKRNIAWQGNAQNWNENALAAGYEIGSIPVTGSIIVFEAGVMAANEQYGHVAYVDNVVEQNGGFAITISEANPVADANGNWIAGTHTTPTQRTIGVQLGSDGKPYDTSTGQPVDISFIYGPRQPV